MLVTTPKYLTFRPFESSVILYSAMRCLLALRPQTSGDNHPPYLIDTDETLNFATDLGIVILSSSLSKKGRQIYFRDGLFWPQNMGCGPWAVSKEKCKIVNSKLIAHGCWWRYCRPLGSKLQEFFWRVILGQSLTSLPFATYLICLCSHSNPDNCLIFLCALQSVEQKIRAESRWLTQFSHHSGDQEAKF